MRNTQNNVTDTVLNLVSSALQNVHLCLPNNFKIIN